MTKRQSESHNQDVHFIENTVGLTDYFDEECADTLISTEYSYDQALELTGKGKFQKVAVLVIGVSALAIVIDGHCMSYVLPTVKCEFKMSTSEQGFMNSVGFLGVIIASHFWGFMADTWGRLKVLRTVLFLACIMSLVSSLSLNSWMLLITRFASGLSIAGVKGTVISYVGELMSNKNRPRYLSFVFIFMTLGVLIQPALGYVVLTRSFQFSFFDGWFVFKPWRVFVFINGLIPGFGFFGTMLMPESPKFLLAMGKPNETLDIMRHIYACNTGNPPEKFPVRNIAPLETGTNLSEVTGFKEALHLVWKQTMPLFYPPYLLNMLMMCGSIFAIFFVTHSQEFWYPQILSYYSKNMDLPITICEAISLGRAAELTARNTTNLLNSTDTISENVEICIVNINPLTYKVATTIGLGLLTINILLGLVVNRFGTKNILTSWLALNTVSVLAIIWTNQFYVNNGFMLILISMNIGCALLTSVYGDLFPTHLRVMALNLIIMFSRLGSVFGINYAAAMIFRFCDTMYGINFLITLGAVIVTYFMLWKCKGETSI